MLSPLRRAAHQPHKQHGSESWDVQPGAMRSAIYNKVRVAALSIGENCLTNVIFYLLLPSANHLHRLDAQSVEENVLGSAHYTFCPFLSGELGNVNNACQGAYYWSSNIALKGKCPNVACFRHRCKRYSIFLLLFQERNDDLIRVAGCIRLGPLRGAARMRRGLAHGERKWAQR